MARILLLSAAMGGGHLQISRELARRFERRGHDARVVDMLDLMPPPTGRWLHWIYPFLVNRTPALYQRVYETFFVAEQRAGERAGIPVRLALPGLRTWVEGFRPDLAVSTYPLCSLALGEGRRRGWLPCPSVTVVTTFSVNNLWVHPANDAEVCISAEAAADAAARTGRRAEVSGPIVRSRFLEPADGSGFRRSLGLPDEARVALVTTGSMGLAGDADLAARTIAGHDGWVPVVLCGRSEALRDQISAISGAVPVDWVEDMPAAMAAADVLVDNNCGMSAKEALGARLPIVTFRPISGHGRDDAAALERLGLTDVVDQPADLLASMDRLVNQPGLRSARAARGRDLFVADAADLVLAHLERQPALAGAAGGSQSASEE
jgi:UDP-N-acetylglucosamine:LPS N-acetylglucosamine transferase